MDRFELIQLEIDHLKFETARLTKQVLALRQDIQFNLSRLAWLIAELAKLRSEKFFS